MRLIGKVSRLLRREILRDPFLLEVKRWKANRGDETLRLDYPLGADSVVMDLGGYHGDFADAIFSRFGSRVFVYEPLPAFFAYCVERFRGNEQITCLPYGLAATAGHFDLAERDDGTSFVHHAPTDRIVRAELRPVVGEIERLGLACVDLLKINIEGGEFDVLPALIDSGLIGRVRYLQVQFHNFVPGAENRRNEIRAALARTHREQWNYEFVWESWSRL